MAVDSTRAASTSTRGTRARRREIAVWVGSPETGRWTASGLKGHFWMLNAALRARALSWATTSALAGPLEVQGLGGRRRVLAMSDDGSLGDGRLV